MSDQPGANESSKDDGEQSAVAVRPITYAVKDVLPPNPTVRLVFQGLMWFIFHGTDECQVGIHNATQGTTLPHRHPHDLNINIWTITGCGTAQRSCGTPMPIHIGNPKTITGIQIDVNNPREDGVYVYQKDPFDPIGSTNNDPNDWRWVIDFEREPLYPTGIKLDVERINPGISINNGLFYTIHKTTTKFDLLPVGGGSARPLGNVAEYVGGNIYLQERGDVTLTVKHAFPRPPQVVRLKWAANVCHQIDIKNVCVKNGMPCEWEPDHNTDRRRRNDFYLYYDTFGRPRGRPEYALKRNQEVAPAPPPDYLCLTERDKAHLRSSNDAPCGAVTAGSGGGN